MNKKKELKLEVLEQTKQKKDLEEQLKSVKAKLKDVKSKLKAIPKKEVPKQLLPYIKKKLEPVEEKVEKKRGRKKKVQA